MKKLFGAGLVGVFLVCGCGGEAALVIKATGEPDVFIEGRVRSADSPEKKLENADKYVKELSGNRIKLVAFFVTRLMKETRSGPASARAAQLRADAAKKLAYLADESATDFLMQKAVQDKSKEVRIECIKALGQLEDYTSVPVLIQLLEDLDEDLAKAALNSLNAICRPVTYREFTFAGTALRERKKTAEQWRRWWSGGGKDQLADHAREG